MISLDVFFEFCEEVSSGIKVFERTSIFWQARGDASAQTRRCRRVGPDASAQTRPSGRVGVDASARTCRSRRVGADASVQTRRRVDASARTRRHRRVSADASARGRVGAGSRHICTQTRWSQLCEGRRVWQSLENGQCIFPYQFSFPDGPQMHFFGCSWGGPLWRVLFTKNVRAYFLLAAPSSRGAPIPAASRARFNS